MSYTLSLITGKFFRTDFVKDGDKSEKGVYNRLPAPLHASSARVTRDYYQTDFASFGFVGMYYVTSIQFETILNFLCETSEMRQGL